MTLLMELVDIHRFGWHGRWAIRAFTLVACHRSMFHDLLEYTPRPGLQHLGRLYDETLTIRSLPCLAFLRGFWRNCAFSSGPQDPARPILHPRTRQSILCVLLMLPTGDPRHTNCGVFRCKSGSLASHVLVDYSVPRAGSHLDSSVFRGDGF